MLEYKKREKHTTYPIYVIGRYTALYALIGHAVFLVLFGCLRITPLVYLNIASCLLYVSVYFLNMRRHHRLVVILSFLEIITHAFAATWFLGWSSGFHIYILCLIPLVYNYRMQSLFWKYFTLGILALSELSLQLLSRSWGYAQIISAPMLENIELMNYLTAALVLMIISATYSISAMELEKQLLLNNDELEKLSRIDPLTGLSNRRDIMEKIAYEKEKMLRYKYASCLILTDIDHFKKINDSRGHNFGDFILQELSGIMMDGVRKQDLVSRWGGEEFLLFLPHTDLAGGHIAAEKLRKSIEDHPFSADKKKVRVTMTFGVALYDPAQEIEVSVKLADTLLYRGKQNGRNRVESSQDRT